MSPVTMESSEGAQPAPPAPPAAQPAAQPAGKPSSSNSLRIGILVVVAALVGVGLWLALGRNSHNKPSNNNIVRPIGPKFESQNDLGSFALLTHQPIYWAGPKRGFGYEFTRLGNDWKYVRYLPKGVKVGNKSAKYLTVSTYPFFNAYNRLKKGSKGKGIDGPGHSYIWQRPNHPTSVLIAWPNVNYEVEVYHPNAAKAASVAESGEVTRVG
jgi:hypothetical protein